MTRYFFGLYNEISFISVLYTTRFIVTKHVGFHSNNIFFFLVFNNSRSLFRCQTNSSFHVIFLFVKNTFSFFIIISICMVPLYGMVWHDSGIWNSRHADLLTYINSGIYSGILQVIAIKWSTMSLLYKVYKQLCSWKNEIQKILLINIAYKFYFQMINNVPFM